jgi:ABC-type multidrug transport system fused ATPase/permease subunit
VLQETVLFAVNVWDNIAFGAQGVSHDTIVKAAVDAGAHEFLKKLPQGYETVLGERGVNLSHGQRQRIAIARAMVRDAPLILLDEHATALDQHNKRLVRESLARLIQGRTTLLVTHDLQDARYADRIILIEKGRVVEEGTHDDLIKAGGSYVELHQLQNGFAHQSKEPINAPLH